MMEFLTEKVVLAMIHKGMAYEFEGMEMEYLIPLSCFGADADAGNAVMKFKVDKCKVEIQQG